MKISKMIELIKENETEFYNTSIIRRRTSVANKELHTEMINAIDNKNWKQVAKLLENKHYHKPLDGVIICMDVNCNIKNEMLKLLWKKL